MFNRIKTIFTLIKVIFVAILAFRSALREIRNYRPPPESREGLIARSLSTVEGRTALAQAMVEPIRTNIREESFSRRIMPPNAIDSVTISGIVDGVRWGGNPRIVKRGNVVPYPPIMFINNSSRKDLLKDRVLVI